MHSPSTQTPTKPTAAPPRGRQTSRLILAIATAALVLLCDASRAARAAPSEVIDPNSLMTVRKLAQARSAELDKQCVETKPTEAEAPSIELAFLEVAGLFSLFFHNFPYGENLSDRTYDALSIANAFSHAFECSPHWDKRHYLTKARSILDLRRRELASEQRPETKDELASLTEAYGALDQRLDGLTRGELRPGSTPGTSPAPPPSAEPEKEKEERGYWAQWRDRLSLRVELGGGRLRFGGIDSDGDTFSPAVAPSVRFLAGEHRRHVFGVGFRYGAHRFRVDNASSDPFLSASPPSTTHWGHTIAATFGYGFRLHPRWFSVHTTFDAGLEIHTQGTVFGREILGATVSLCTWGEAVCLQVRGFSTLHGASGYFDGILVGTSLDIFRITDNALRKRREP